VSNLAGATLWTDDFSADTRARIGGYIHLCLYRNGFRAIPKIGTGFLLQVVTSALLAGALLVGRDRILQVGRFLVRRAVAVRTLGLSLSLGTLAAFGLTRTPMGLFNFTERGLQPAPQALSMRRRRVSGSLASFTHSSGRLVDPRDMNAVRASFASMMIGGR